MLRKAPYVNQLPAILLALTIVLCSSCKSHKEHILEIKNFSKGSWLLVVENGATHTNFVIDDEQILKDNPSGIQLGPHASCPGTTCDGFVKLYRDGELVDSREYLSDADLIVSANIRKAYRRARVDWLHPDKADFQTVWDSLRIASNTYPTRYQSEPDMELRIEYYQLETIVKDFRVDSSFFLEYSETGLGSKATRSAPWLKVSNDKYLLSIVDCQSTYNDIDTTALVISSGGIRRSSIDSIVHIVKQLSPGKIFRANSCIYDGRIYTLKLTIDSISWRFDMKNTAEPEILQVFRILNTYLSTELQLPADEKIIKDQEECDKYRRPRKRK
jgi:hypothetical protein